MSPNKRAKLDIVASDRFSELPDAVIHHILSLVPTVYAIRMSILSKRWRKMWLALPVLDLSSFGGIVKSKKLCTFVSKCFKLRKIDMLNDTDTMISALKLTTFYSWQNIDRWLNLVANSNVKDLDLRIHKNRKAYFLPVVVLRMRSLTHLSLFGVSIEGHDSSMCLSSLKFLSLKSLRLDDRVVDNLLLSCPSLENLVVNHCEGLSSFKISSSRLKFMEFSSYFSVALRVEATNLESFVCRGFSFEFKSVFLSCANLRTLTFSRMKLNDDWFEDLISRLPCLESFNLLNCALKSVKITSHSLKRFVFQSDTSHDETKIVMHTPNLAYFSFTGDPMLDISMNLPNLLEAKLKFIIGNYNATWYTNLLYFLSNLGRAVTVGLYAHSEEALVIPHRIRKVCKAPSLTVKHMNVRTSKPLSTNSDLKDSLFWITPSLETLSMEHEPDVK